MVAKATAVALSCVLLLSSCSSAAPAGTVSAVSSSTLSASESVQPDPIGAIDKIYEAIDIIELTMADDTTMTELFGFDLETDVEEYFVKYSNSRFGVSDVYIIKPRQDRNDAVRNSLELRREARIAECSNYDVLGSLDISKTGAIFEHGGYVIMLLVEDKERATAIIEEYIPRLKKEIS